MLVEAQPKVEAGSAGLDCRSSDPTGVCVTKVLGAAKASVESGWSVVLGNAPTSGAAAGEAGAAAGAAEAEEAGWFGCVHVDCCALHQVIDEEGAARGGIRRCLPWHSPVSQL